MQDFILAVLIIYCQVKKFMYLLSLNLRLDIHISCQLTDAEYKNEEQVKSGTERLMPLPI